MVMKRDPRAIDEIESLEEAKEIIGMMLGNHYMHNTAYEMLKILEETTMIYITGDIHGSPERLGVHSFMNRRE